MIAASVLRLRGIPSLFDSLLFILTLVTPKSCIVGIDNDRLISRTPALIYLEIRFEHAFILLEELLEDRTAVDPVDQRIIHRTLVHWPSRASSSSPQQYLTKYARR